MPLIRNYSLHFSIAILLCLWGTIILFISPAGEFMINDDWIFISIVEDLLTGEKVNATGWGDGGPSILFHILWGLLFSLIFGFSVTTLRISVLFLAICGSLAFLVLLRQIGTRRWVALWATLTLLLNPIFLSQSFTFMTDISFLSMVIFSILFLHIGVEKGRDIFLVAGLFCSLLAILTRQIGLVIPLGFLATIYLHPKGKKFKFSKILLMTVIITIVPWFCYELYLWKTGSTPIISHPVFKNITLQPMAKGIADYTLSLLSRTGIILLYTSFFLSPLLVLRTNQLVKLKAVRRIIVFSVIAFLLFEICLIAGLINPPIGFHRNIIYNFGIGPVLLKDIYLLGIQRTLALPKPLFYLIVFWSLLSAAALLYFSTQTIQCLLSKFQKNLCKDKCFTSSFALISVFIYSGIIILTGFHDRYLIPVCTLLTIWIANQISMAKISRWSFPVISSFIIVLFLGGMSILGVKDFMSTKRSLHKAHHHIIKDMGVNPCLIDGGFEFNGYHCSKINHLELNDTYSWWWVSKEKYLITLGPLPSYQTVKMFPFSRYLGNDGAIHILEQKNVQ